MTTTIKHVQSQLKRWKIPNNTSSEYYDKKEKDACRLDMISNDWYIIYVYKIKEIYIILKEKRKKKSNEEDKMWVIGLYKGKRSWTWIIVMR